MATQCKFTCTAIILCHVCTHMALGNAASQIFAHKIFMAATMLKCMPQFCTLINVCGIWVNTIDRPFSNAML